MAPKGTKSTAKANAASKRPHWVNDPETKLKMLKDFESGKSVMFIARQSSLYQSTIATILKNNNEVTKAFKGSTYFLESKKTD